MVIVESAATGRPSFSHEMDNRELNRIGWHCCRSLLTGADADRMLGGTV